MISLPFGTPVTYLAIGSSRDSFSSPASCISKRGGEGLGQRADALVHVCRHRRVRCLVRNADRPDVPAVRVCTPTRAPGSATFGEPSVDRCVELRPLAGRQLSGRCPAAVVASAARSESPREQDHSEPRPSARSRGRILFGSVGSSARPDTRYGPPPSRQRPRMTPMRTARSTNSPCAGEGLEPSRPLAGTADF